MNRLLLLMIISCLKTIFGTSSYLKEAVDLTWPFDNNTIYWPNSQSFVFSKQVANVGSGGFWYAVNDFCAGEHGGTHFDAPYHFDEQGWKVGEVPLSRLIVRGVKIDISAEVATLKDKALLLPEHLEKWEEENGSIPKDSVLLIYFGWSKYYSNKTQYLGIDSENNLNFPGISNAAAEWIVGSGKIVGVGLDTASIDPGNTKTYLAHRTFALNQIYVLENVKIPPVFPDKGFILYVMPMKIQHGTGAPLRLIAVPDWVPGMADMVPPHLAMALPSSAVPIFNHAIVILATIVVPLL